eukprot:TRINITY_DN12028_c0_g2_i1.p1 TRINITY_DN12028_c0_g2~~TRINITY_DN12028_c0_g2_i1.p1  ORF type:complete len:152 (+),score=28.06 TRINITY_DN12028_c0_g2_i1:23-478(+)
MHLRQSDTLRTRERAFVFIDDTSLWKGGQLRGTTRYDAGQLIKAVVGADDELGCAYIYGTTPPESDTLWRAIRGTRRELRVRKSDMLEKRNVERTMNQIISEIAAVVQQQDQPCRLIVLSEHADMQFALVEALCVAIELSTGHGTRTVVRS